MKALLFIAAAALLSFSFGPANNFKLVKSEDGVSLYERWYSLGNGKNARELKAVFTVKNHYSAVIAALQNQSKGLEWNESASQFAIRNQSSVSWVNYIRYDLPWPLDDQDCVLQYSRSDGAGGSVLHFASTSHSDFPVKSDISRIPNVKGKWLLYSQSGKTYVEYYITTTPSATLPRSITDPVVRNNLVSGFANFRKLAE
jgi:hypothetical protein